ncbi:VRR-Nuc domain protein [Streptomyces phage LibertyBell]|nr:VRR-Nuc domain protein [Streptomyces phage LibertyBell]
MQEREYQAKLIKKLRTLFPGCVVLKNDPEYLQGIPDLLILHGDRWAMLEVKAGERSPQQPNQDYYVRKLDGMAFARFIYPSIEKEVLDALREALSVQ